jgi:hypothetical protein
MKLDITENENYYACDPPPGYFFRPVRAWMEANVKAINEFDWSLGDPDPDHLRDRINLIQAKAIDFEGNIWFIDDKGHDGVYSIYKFIN